jgi:hypothetical protein
MNMNEDLLKRLEEQTKLVASLELEKIVLEEKLKAAIGLADTYHKSIIKMIDSKIESLEQTLKDA